MPGQAAEPFTLVSRNSRGRLPDDVADAFPLTHAQTALLQHVPDPGAPRIAGCRVSRLPYSADALRTAAGAVLHRHEVLRVTVDVTGCPEPLQRLHARAAVPVTEHDHRGLEDDERRRASAALLDASRTASFDLLAAPLLRLDAVLEDREWVLLLALPRMLSQVVGADAVLARIMDDYRRVLAGQRPASGPVTRYAPWVAAERERLLDRSGRAYWRGVIRDNAPFTLPRAWGGAAAAEGRAERTVDFSDLTGRLSALAADAGVPLRTVLLAAHLKVLSMLTSEPSCYSHVVCGPGGGQGAGEEDAEDPLHRVTLPLAMTRPAGTWRDLVVRAHRAERTVREHRHVPVGADGALGLPVHASFESRLPPAPGAADGTSRAGGITDLVLRQGFDEHPLEVVVLDGRIRLSLCPETIAPPYRDTLGRMYRLVLEGMAADPGADAAAACLPPEERRLVLRDWAVGPVADRGTASVVELIRAQAQETPDAVAVRMTGAALTYRELDRRSDQLAHHLAGLGAGPDTLVGVHLGRTADLLPALLGVWKAGAGHLPLDPSLPAERKRQMLHMTGRPPVVTTSEHRSALAESGAGTLVLLDEEAEKIAAQPASPVPVEIEPSHLAYVIYTSGSTGVPKGVMVQHGGLANYLRWAAEAYAGRGTGGAPVFSSISFDLGIPNLFAPLMTGQSVHLLPDPCETADLGRHLAAGAPYSFIKMTPGHLDLLTHQLTAEEARGLAGLVIAAGDSFPVSLAARWTGLAGPDGTGVATEYGPTEITIGNSGQVIETLPGTELVPLGRPIPNTTMYVLTDDLEPVPVGVPGEVYIGGSGVARGYLGRPDLTDERFLPDPHGPRGARLYRTGDLARWLPDGSLDFLGRTDNQVKIRGYRVELGEIEANLGRHPDVRDAVVVPREHAVGDLRLIAYVVPADGRTLDGPGLRAYLASALPDYMVPVGFVRIDHIPLTANGKVNARALPDPA